MKRTVCVLCGVLLCGSLWAQGAIEKANPDSSDYVKFKHHPAKTERGERMRVSAEQHLKLYGFIRNQIAFDTRESVLGGADFDYMLPKDRKLNEYGQDLNAIPSMRYLAVTTRAGLDVLDYQVGNTKMGGRIEVDFCAGLTGVTGTALLRLRHAYMTFLWDKLPMGKTGQEQAEVKLLMGQTWHPMAADQPLLTSLEAGAPFTAHNRSPQIQLDARLSHYVTLTAAALWQMQYVSTGPEGPSANYIKYALTPEGYIGLQVNTGGFMAKVGVDVLSITPRKTALDAQGVEVLVSDRITTSTPFLFLQYQYKSFIIKAKTFYGNAGEHLQLLSGYAATPELFEDAHRTYSPLRCSTSWLSFAVGNTFQGMFFVGYSQNLGTRYDIDPSEIYFSKNANAALCRAIRVQPTFAYTWHKLSGSLAYNFTAVQFGEVEDITPRALPSGPLHWVANHRIQAMVTYRF